MNDDDTHIDRRRLVGGALAMTGLAAFPIGIPSALGHSPDLAPLDARPTRFTAAPWTAYFGAVRDQPRWSSAQRAGNFTDPSGRVRIDAVRELLQDDHLVSQPPPHPQRTTLAGVAAFMNRVRATDGRWWRDVTQRFTADHIRAHRTTPYKVIGLQLGNEITDPAYRDNLERWARGAGLPFPHPRSNYGDDGWYSRDHLGYYVEYFLAPALQGARVANGRVLPRYRIPIVLGSVVGVRDPFVRNRVLPALLNYRIGGQFAPALRGRLVKNVVRYMSIHYLLTPEDIFGYDDRRGRPLPYASLHALDDLHQRWVGNGAIDGIWHTEEGGKLAQLDDRHASLALRVFARTMSWAVSRGASPSQIRVFGFYQPPPEGWPPGAQLRRVTSWRFAFSVLHQFLGSARLAGRSAGVGVDSTDPVERYAFETSDRTRRVVVVTPQTASFQGATSVRSISMRADGWTSPASRVVARGHLFKSDSQGYRSFPVGVRRSADGRRYHLRLPSRVLLNPNSEQRSLLITIRRR
jgi:hypothetical protein